MNRRAPAGAGRSGPRARAGAVGRLLAVPANAMRDALARLGAIGDDGRPAEGEAGDAWASVRPSLPPLLLVALALWAACAATLDSLYGAQPGTCRAVCLVALAGLLLAGIALARSRTIAGCLLLGVFLGCLLGSSQALVQLQQAEALQQTGGSQVVTVERDARSGDFGSWALAHTAEGSLVRLQFSGEVSAMVGERLSFSGSYAPPSAKTARSSWRQGVVAVVRVSSFERHADEGPVAALREARRLALARIGEAGGVLEGRWGRLAGLLDEQGAQEGAAAEAGLFLRAVLLGYTDGLYGSALYQVVRVDGLAHMLAVSGAHLVIVCGMAMTAFRRLALPRSAAVLLQVGFVGGYLVLTGVPVSAVRAAVMTSLGLLAYFAGRRAYALGGLSLCLVAMLVLDPTAAFSTSFVLSVGATLGIVLFSGLFGDWISALAPRLGPGLSDAIALTLAASVATGPVSACLFGQVSLVAPLANALAAPVFPVACALGFAALAVGVPLPGLGTLLLAASMALLLPFFALLHALAAFPLASVPASVPLGLALLLAAGVPLALWALWPRPARRSLPALAALCASLALAAAVFPLLQGDQVVMLDVGQGDAFLVRSCGHALLIDTGTDDVALLQGLGACGVRSLDAVLVTHPDDDHCGSLGALKGVVGVRRVLVARDLLSDSDSHCVRLRSAAARLVGEGNVMGLAQGDAFSLGNLSFRVVGPAAFADSGGNADSLTIFMRADDDADGRVDHTALFCGDAESEQLEAYRRAGLLEPVEIYKVGHHGSRAALTPALAGFLHPAVSLVSVGEYNHYGHPVPETLELLRQQGSSVFRTDTQGMVACSLKPERLEVTTQR